MIEPNTHFVAYEKPLPDHHHKIFLDGVDVTHISSECCTGEGGFVRVFKLRSTPVDGKIIIVEQNIDLRGNVAVRLPGPDDMQIDADFCAKHSLIHH